MKLYYSPGACSLSPQIVASEAGIEVELERVDRDKTTSAGKNYMNINPKGYVPALELDNGELLTEGQVIVQYLADRKPQSQLMPAAGTMERYRVQETLGYINSEIHKIYGSLYQPNVAPEARQERETSLRRRYEPLEKSLSGKAYLFGEHFTVADAYLFTVTRWADWMKVDLTAFPNVLAFQARAGARPGVQAALRAEGQGQRK